jgi:hypothetical protein
MRNKMTGRCTLALLGSVAAVAVVGASLIDGSMNAVLAQAETRPSASVDFHGVLSPHGRWERHSRWGEVWLPGNRPRDWRPYTHGHWAYTDEWGWYWISAQEEQDWGWVAFHYGRWVFDPDQGWIWIPRNEWGPGWVDWRRGGERVGWAPLPPEEILVEVEERPQGWIFVRDRDFVAPRIADVILPPRDYDVFIRDTVVVNRTIVEERESIAINPGIEPEFIAAAVGRPLVPVEVRPPVLAGTVGVSNAVEVHATEQRRVPVAVTENRQASIQPAQNIPPPAPLRPDEKGRLGEHPLTAAREPQQPGTTAPGTEQPHAPSAPAETRREQPGAPGAAQRSPAPGGPEQRRPSAERGPVAAPEQRGQAPAQPQPGRGSRGERSPATTQGRPEQRGAVTSPERGGRPEQGRASPPGERGGRAEERRWPPSRAEQRRGGRAEEHRGPSAAEQERGGRGSAAEQRGGAMREQRPPSSAQGRGEERRGGPGMAQEPHGGAPRGAGPPGGAGQSHGRGGMGERQQ